MATDAFSNALLISSKNFTKENFDLIRSYKRRTNVTTRCRLPKFCERYKKDTGIYDLKSKRILPSSVKERNICLYIHKNHFCVFWKKNRNEFLVNGREDMARNFIHVENKMNEDNSGQGNRYGFPN